MKFVAIFCLFLTSAECANILGIFTLPYFSHQTFHHSIMRGLVERGHNVTIFTTYPQDYGNNPNVTQHHFSKSVEIHEKHTDMLMYKRKKLNWWQIMINHEMTAYEESVHHEMELPEMQDLIHNSTKHKFDLLILECFFCPFMQLAHIYDCPIVISGPSDVPSSVHAIMGNDVDPTRYCEPEFLPFVHRDMTILQQAYSTIFYLFYDLAFRLVHFLKILSLQSEYLSHVNVSYKEIVLSRIALLMTDTNTDFGHVRPIMHDTIQIGFSHIQKPKEITNLVLKKYLDSSKNGVVVMALGSRADPRSLGIENVKKFMSGFNMTNMNILWKLHGVDDGIEVAENVKIMSWLPLPDVLAHPNVKLLIFHGGLLTSYEAIDRKVPMIVFPLAFDQYLNTRLMAKNGIAMEMDLNNFDDVSLFRTIEEMRKPEYAENVKKMRQRVYDRPISSKDLAIWSIEKVLRSPKYYPRSVNAIYESQLLHLVLYVLLFVGSLRFVYKKIVSVHSKTIFGNENSPKNWINKIK